MGKKVIKIFINYRKVYRKLQFKFKYIKKWSDRVKELDIENIFF